MKKLRIISVSIMLALIILVTGCSTGALVVSMNEPWTYAEAPTVNDTDSDYNGYSYEELVYDVFIDEDYLHNEILQSYKYMLSGEGTYTSTLYYKGREGNIFIETELVFNGKYTERDGDFISDDFTSTKTTVTELARVEKNFFPVASSRITDSYFIHFATDESISLKNMKYKETLNYTTDGGDRTAEGTMKMWNETNKDYTDAVPQSPSYQNETVRATDYSFKNLENKLVFDNNTMLYNIRAFASAGGTVETFTQNYYSIDLEQGKLAEMTVTSNKTDTDNTYTPITYNVGSDSVTKLAYKMYVSQSSTNAGEALTLWYSNDTLDNGSTPKYLLKMQQYDVIYTLQTINGDPVTTDE